MLKPEASKFFEQLALAGSDVHASLRGPAKQICCRQHYVSSCALLFDV